MASLVEIMAASAITSALSAIVTLSVTHSVKKALIAFFVTLVVSVAVLIAVNFVSAAAITVALKINLSALIMGGGAVIKAIGVEHFEQVILGEPFSLTIWSLAITAAIGIMFGFIGGNPSDSVTLKEAVRSLGTKEGKDIVRAGLNQFAATNTAEVYISMWRTFIEEFRRTNLK